ARQPRIQDNKNLERETGFEPATSTLARSHSTTELLPLSEKHSSAPVGTIINQGAVSKKSKLGEVSASKNVIQPAKPGENMNWLTWALLSAFFAALTAILAKDGLQAIDSNLATAIRTVVIVVFAWSVAAFTNRQTMGSI